MAKPEWGTKRICQSCGARFYDFGRSPIVCPACSAVFDLEILNRAQCDYAVKERAWTMIERPGTTLDVLRRLDGIELPDPLRAALTEILLSDG